MPSDITAEELREVLDYSADKPTTPLNECPVCKAMVESKVHCKHCNAHMEPELWYKDKPTPPAPTADEVMEAREFLSKYGHEN